MAGTRPGHDGGWISPAETALLRGRAAPLRSGGGSWPCGSRRGASRQIFGNDRAIELPHGAVRQALPHLVHAKEWNAEIAPHGQYLPVGAQRHHRAVDGAIARIEDIAVLIAQAVAPHISDEGEPEQRCVPAVVGASGTGRMGIVDAGSHKELRKCPLEGAVALHEDKPSDRLAGLVLFLP